VIDPQMRDGGACAPSRTMEAVMFSPRQSFVMAGTAGLWQRCGCGASFRPLPFEQSRWVNTMPIHPPLSVEAI